MTVSLIGVAALGVLALGAALTPRSRLSAGTGTALTVLCAAGMIIVSEFWSLVVQGAVPGVMVLGEPDVDLAFAAVWLLALIPLVRRSQSDPSVLRPLLDLLIAAAFVGFAMDVATAVVCPAVEAAGSGMEDPARVALDGRDALLALLLLSGAFLGGAVLCETLAPGGRFPWEYAPLFAALLLLFTPSHPLLLGLRLNRWHGVATVAVWLVALALVYQVRRASVAAALIGALAALTLPLSLSILAWIPTP